MKNGICEPVHQWISISGEEKDLINSPLFQRLQGLKQLGLAYTVFPGAVHTRFLHCLGVMHLAGKYARHLFQDDPNKEKIIQICRIAGLLHDIGHGPFSHTWDKVVYSRIYPNMEKGHDTHRFTIIAEPSMVKLIKACGITVFDVVNAWVKEPLCSIIQGPIGADRMDYMMRDAYFTGTSYFGTVAIERIIHNSFISRAGKLLFNSKVRDNIDRALEGRDYLYLNVYQHHTVLKASKILEELLEEAINFGIPLIEWTNDMKEFIRLDEIRVMGTLRNIKREENEKIFTLCECLLDRNLNL